MLGTRGVRSNGAIGTHANDAPSGHLAGHAWRQETDALRIALVTAFVVSAASATPAVAAVPRCGAAAAAADAVGPPTGKLAWRARLVDITPVRKYMSKAASRMASLDPVTAEAALVLDARRDPRGRCWLRVRLPSRPNRAAGWINAARVRLRATPWRIVVDRRRRTVTLRNAGQRVTRVRAVVGTGKTPTPQGLFAIASVWRNAPDDFLGAWILPLTAHSDVLKTFDGGDGRVALHGRGGTSLNDPLGSASSHGCIRFSNSDIARLVRLIGTDALPGTPVRIG